MAVTAIQKLANLQQTILRLAREAYAAERVFRKDGSFASAERWKAKRKQAISAMNRLESYRTEQWPSAGF